MKYIRKAIIIVLVAVFVAAAAIGLSVIFAVRNVNVFAVAYDRGGSVSAEFASAVEKIEADLSSLRGRIMSGINEDTVAGLIDEGYAEFVSYEEVLPCTVNVTVRERVEVFAVSSEEGGYEILDGGLKRMAVKPFNVNNLDGSPNVLLENVPEDSYPLVAQIAELINEKFSSVRAFAESISVVPSELSGRGDSLNIKLRCGLTMEIREYASSAAEKAEALFEAFGGMSDTLKLGGTMYCLASEDGAMRVVLPDGTYQ